MAVKMRLRREGKRKQPYYRVVVADVRSPRDGRFIEDLGYYQPLREPSSVHIDRDRALYWLRNGVEPSDAVVKLLRIEGIWEEFRPGDPGKDRSDRYQARAAAAARREEAARAEAAAAAAQRAEGEAAADSASGVTGAAPVAEADHGSVEQARGEGPQPDPGPSGDAGALEEGEQP